VYDILKAKSEIKNQWINCNGSIERKLRKTRNEAINEIVWEWFVSARYRNFRISGTMLQEHAKEVAEKLGKSEFKASNGWSESFRTRLQIVFNEFCGESEDVCRETSRLGHQITFNYTDTDQRTLQMVTKQNIFTHYEAKLCVWKVEDAMVENFAKKS
jgi:hypothetical protein